MSSPRGSARKASSPFERARSPMRPGRTAGSPTPARSGRCRRPPRRVGARLSPRYRPRLGVARGRWRADREGAPSTRRRPVDRVRPDALPGPRRLARTAHAVHLEPGRLRRGLSVLCHGRARLRPRPRDRRDRRPGPPRRSPAGRRRQAPHEHRVHGHGRAAAEPRPRPGGRRGAQRPASVRPRGPAHHRLHVRGRARDPPPHGARPAVHAGRSRSTPPATPCATCSSRSTDAGRWPRSSTRREPTLARRAGGSATSTR